MTQEFRINNRVIATQNFGNIETGMVGTIRDTTSHRNEPGVEWDSWNGGHSLNGRLTNNAGYYVTCESIAKVSSGPRGLGENQRRKIMEVYESGIITQNEKNRQIQSQEEKLYLNYFSKVNTTNIPKLKLLYLENYGVGTIVKTNKLAKMLESHIIFTEGVIVRKSGGMNVNVLVYQQREGEYLREGIVRQYNIKYLSRIKKPKCTLKLADEGRLFPPKVIMTLKAKDINEMVKNIKQSINKVEDCIIIDGITGDNHKYIIVTTKELIFKYKKKKYNFGKYKLKFMIPNKGEKLSTNGDNLVSLSPYISARRVEGAFRTGENSSDWYHNPYIHEVYITDDDLSEEELKMKRKEFKEICYGAGYKRAEEAYKSRDYYVLTEITIGNLLSDSNEGYVKFSKFLPNVPKVK